MKVTRGGRSSIGLSLLPSRTSATFVLPASAILTQGVASVGILIEKAHFSMFFANFLAAGKAALAAV